MADKPFGLDIGPTTIKAVWFADNPQGFSIKGISVFPAPPKGIMSESPLDQGEMIQSIKSAVAEAKIQTPNVNLALPESQVYTKVLEMPVLSDKELASAIYWEAEQYIPVPLQNITLDWKVLHRPQVAGTNEKMIVLLVGAPTALVDKYSRIIELAGLNINSLETEILAVIRSIVKGEKFPNSVIVHIGSVSTLLAIIKQGNLVFTYSIQTGGLAINRAIAADFGFSMQQAEEYKNTYGVSEKNLSGKIGQATAPIITSIATEVKKAISFYNDKYKNDSPIAQIVLSGANAKLPGIDLFFAQNCGLETAIANPWKNLISQDVPKEILDEAPDYTVVVGLGMRDYDRD